MAEAVLQVLIENLASLIQEEIGLILGVNKEMKKLSDTLTAIQKVLEDAEDQQYQNRAIRNWLSKLNEIAFEIEDILDECNTEVSKLKHKGSGRFNFVKKTLYNYKIGGRMKEVADKLHAIAADRNNFQLSETQFVAESRQVDWRRETGPIVSEPDHIYGRDEDRDKIVDVLVNQVPNSDHQLSVLPIIGVGGLGKTTLAQLVYKDERVTKHFDTKLWVCVSDNFDLKTLVKAMIAYATEEPIHLMELAALQERLQKVLNGKKYLLILDDVWNENQEAWVQLKSMLACGSKGSSIVVTTRLQKVGDIMRTRPAYCLKELLEEHCWLLFRLRAFGQEIDQNHPKLEAIGRQIVKKCAGVPLAAKALGGLLRFKREEKEWIRVEESEIWNLPEEEENSILPVLRLSYRHLPVVLKRCFVYCAIFPKDDEIDKDDLILRWMAHGCISSKGKQEVEDVGDEVWKELVLRSFFQEVKTTNEGETTFKMHDLVHDLAQSIMENKIPGAEMKDSNTSASNSNIREVHYSEDSDDETYSSSIVVQVSTLTTIMKYNRLRILRILMMDSEDSEDSDDIDDIDMVEKLPSAIGKLKHLRYFLLLSDSIQTLPHTFCGLWNLQTLILGCSKLKSLPKDIRCMTNLRHIILIKCDELSDMPSRIGELTCLKTLSLFIVGVKIGNQLDELENLDLGDSLKIKHLERVQNHMNPERANLGGKPNLRKLVLGWEGESRSSKSANMMDDEKVLEALEPHVNLETLRINGFNGGQFPLWMTKMENLTKIKISDCPHCSHLPQLKGLPRLRSLILRDLVAMEYISGEDDIGVEDLVFPSLEVLELKNLPNLKGLLKKEVGVQKMFPNLERLEISNCELVEMGEEIRYLHLLKRLALHSIDEMVSLPQGLQHIPTLQFLRLDTLRQLTSLPDWLGNLTSLTHLHIMNCRKLTSLPSSIKGMENLSSLYIWECPELKRRCEKEKGEDWHIIAHIPHISWLSINPHSGGDIFYTRRRNRPTASNRRRRVEEAGRLDPPIASTSALPLIEYEAPTEEAQSDPDHDEEAAPEEAEREDDDDDDILRGPCPGGPIDPQLIPSFKSHIAYAIWNGDERPIVKCWCHTTKMETWQFEGQNPAWEQLLQRSPNPDLRWVSYKTPNKNLICAFFERWQPETNTFHMSWGEITITLDDVVCLTGLPVSGRSVMIPDSRNRPEPTSDLLSRLLGVSVKAAKEGLEGLRGGSVKMEWLRRQFEGDTSSQNPLVLERAARAYQLFVLGCTLFADKTGTRASSKII